MLNQIMPPSVDITQGYLPPFWDDPKDTYDLVIIGNGHSIFTKTLSDDFLKFIQKNKTCLGIFGLQYKEALEKDKINRLFDSLDYWFARNIDDLNYIGDTNTSSTHLGDWLINSFPMTKWDIDKELIIKPGFIDQRIDLLSVIQEV